MWHLLLDLVKDLVLKELFCTQWFVRCPQLPDLLLQLPDLFLLTAQLLLRGVRRGSNAAHSGKVKELGEVSSTRGALATVRCAVLEVLGGKVPWSISSLVVLLKKC